MKIPTSTIAIGLLLGLFLFSSTRQPTSASQPQKLQPGTLCATTERVIFSCSIRRPAKIVSLCASKELTSERGYAQYRFGLPGGIELEYPKERTSTQEKFHYTHYFRAQVDMTRLVSRRTATNTKSPTTTTAKRSRLRLFRVSPCAAVVAQEK